MSYAQVSSVCYWLAFVMLKKNWRDTWVWSGDFGKDCGLASRVVGYRRPVTGDERDVRLQTHTVRSVKVIFSLFSICFIKLCSTIISGWLYSLKCGVFPSGLRSPASHPLQGQCTRSNRHTSGRCFKIKRTSSYKHALLRRTLSRYSSTNS